MLYSFEQEARNQGFSSIAGVDEAGRGPLAGPVVAASCILPFGLSIPYLNDSKKLTPKKRSELFSYLKAHPDIRYAVGICTHVEIDEINILQASLLAMIRSFEPLSPDYLLIDGNKKPNTSLPGLAIVKGDSLSPSIAAASIIAKETRDQLMQDYHTKWPAYNFAKHKGYPTKDHLEALKTHGPSPIHRLTFAPVAKYHIVK